MEAAKPESLGAGVHAKLLNFDILSLTISPLAFHRGSLSLSFAECIGTVTYREHKPDRFLKFLVDDGTGCLPCILWLNGLTSPHLMSSSEAAFLAEEVRIGAVVRVRGRITNYRRAVQITVERVAAERDPNVEILHWLDCLKLARRVYDR